MLEIFIPLLVRIVHRCPLKLETVGIEAWHGIICIMAWLLIPTTHALHMHINFLLSRSFDDHGHGRALPFSSSSTSAVTIKKLGRPTYYCTGL